MCFHVFIEVLFHVEVLSAPLAHELLVSDVDAHMGAELVFVLEALAAVLKRRTGNSFTQSRFTAGCQRWTRQVVLQSLWRKSRSRVWCFQQNTLGLT